MKKLSRLSISIITLSLVVTFLSVTVLKAGSKKGVVLFSSSVYSEPMSTSKKITRVNRGELIFVKKCKKNKESVHWCNVELSDNETMGWIKKKYVHQGDKKPITLTKKSSLYVRPDIQSQLIKTLQRGTKLLILKAKSNGWKKVSLDFNKNGWIKTEDFEKGFK